MPRLQSHWTQRLPRVRMLTGYSTDSTFQTVRTVDRQSGERSVDTHPMTGIDAAPKPVDGLIVPGTSPRVIAASACALAMPARWAPARAASPSRPAA